MFTKNLQYLAAFLTLSLSVSSCHWFKHEPLGGSSQQKAQTTEREELPSVFVSKVDKQELYDPLVLAGVIKAQRRHVVVASIAGSLASVAVKEGQHVRKGQLLLSIKPDSLGLEYKNHKVFAPISGTLTKFRLELGQRISQHDTIGEIEDLSQVETEVNATLEDLNSLREGLMVDVILAPQSPWELKTSGQIVHISPSAEEKTQTFPTLVSIDCSSPVCRKSLRLGTMAKVIAKQDLRLGIKLPSRFLYQQQSKLLVLEDGNIARWVPIKTGKVYGHEVEIIEGVESGAMIITAFSSRPDDGEKVTIGNNNTPSDEKEGEIAKKPSSSASQS